MAINKLIIRTITTICFINITLYSCKSQEKTVPQPGKDFKNYWYSGKAELSSYFLKQARYGELHKGKAVLIFVTEDFSESKHVKLDHPENAGNDAVSVLKLNKIRQFNTGVYSYSMMLSGFVPVDESNYPYPLKITSSSQDWCGHTFSQLNLGNNQYQHQLFSYFESEGDQSQILPLTHLEDGIWQKIRLNPSQLPQGKIKIIPSLEHARLRHLQLKAEEALATMKKDSETTIYELKYQTINRRIAITFQTPFPHTIIRWEEEYTSGFGENQKVLTTTAERINTLQLDYWNHHQLKDSILQEKLFTEPR